MSVDKFRSDEFIARFLAGDISVEERKELEQWKLANPDDGAFFDEMGDLWGRSQKLKINRGKSADDRWNSLSQSIANDQAPVGRTFSWRVISIAASVLLIAAITVFLTQSRSIEIIAPMGAESMIVYLPDSSKVTLSADSKISYNPKTWTKVRNLILNGEGFFEVRKSTVPFSVVTTLSSVQVLGTSFNVKERDNEVTVYCETGRVSVSSGDQENASILLTAGFKTSRKSGNAFSKPIVDEEPWKIVSWRNGVFYFSAEPLSLVFKEVERQFDISINLPADFQDLRFTGSFSRADLNKALEIICLSSGLEFELTDSKVRVFEK